MALHLTFVPSAAVRNRLDEWDDALRRDARLGPGDWRTLVVWPAARDAAISGSTGIEGNPLDPSAVQEVLAGAAIEADSDHIREVENYYRALNLARDAAARPGFTWSHEVLHLINATVMEGLPRDTHGNYRGQGEDVYVGIFTGPSPLTVQPLMDEVVEGLQRTSQTPLVRSALLHLNLIAIHPFNDGNGRTARILAAMELVRDGVRSPELISIEAYLRRDRDEYVAMLRTTLGRAMTPTTIPSPSGSSITPGSASVGWRRGTGSSMRSRRTSAPCSTAHRRRRADRVGVRTPRRPSQPNAHRNARSTDWPVDASSPGRACPNGPGWMAGTSGCNSWPMVCANRALDRAAAPRPRADASPRRGRPTSLV